MPVRKDKPYNESLLFITCYNWISFRNSPESLLAHKAGEDSGRKKVRSEDYYQTPTEALERRLDCRFPDEKSKFVKKLTTKIMYTESKKMSLIKEAIELDSESVWAKLESVLKATKTKKRKKTFTARDFAGIITKKDAALMTKAIEEGCEQINPDDWK